MLTLSGLDRLFYITVGIDHNIPLLSLACLYLYFHMPVSTQTCICLHLLYLYFHKPVSFFYMECFACDAKNAGVIDTNTTYFQFNVCLLRQYIY
jgi:hypothetical protein